tara:strand:- start:2 stop:778 length:777 start_codon:yes stop_codon:yes gene_type:complete
MKTKILKVASIAIFALTSLVTVSNAEVFRIGITGTAGEFSAKGSETIKQSHKVRTTERDAWFAAPSVFVEKNLDGIIPNVGNLITIGFDMIPGTATFSKTSVLSGYNATTNAGSTRASGCPSAAACAGNAGNDTGTQKAGIKLQNHKMVYIQLHAPMNESLYIKIAGMNVDIETVEDLATGSSYGDKNNLKGASIGIGFTNYFEDSFFYKAEAAYSEYEDIDLKGSVSTANGETGAFNRLKAENIEGSSLRLSLGKAF